jgi:hypothetical protein
MTVVTPLEKLNTQLKKQEVATRFQKSHKKEKLFDPTQEIRIMAFQSEMPVPVKIPKWKLLICKWIGVRPSYDVYTRGYLFLDPKTMLWPGAVIRTRELSVDIVLIGNVEGNQYMYASTTGTDKPHELFKETRATFIGTTQLPKPQANKKDGKVHKNSKKITSTKTDQEK